MNEEACLVLIFFVIAVFVIYAFFTSTFFANNWWYFLVLTVIAVSTALYRSYVNDRRFLIAEAKEIATCVNEAAKVYRQVESRLSSKCIIDSNIWMNEHYEHFFALAAIVCERSNLTIDLPNVQFDEITNLKRTKKYGSPQNARSRLAVNRIETFQTANHLKIIGIRENASRDAYADPLLVRLVMQHVERREPVVLLSDDRELRIRLRQRLNDQNADKWEIIGLDELCDDPSAFFAANQLLPVKTDVALAEPTDAQRSTWRNGARNTWNRKLPFIQDL